MDWLAEKRRNMNGWMDRRNKERINLRKNEEDVWTNREKDGWKK